MSKNDTKIEKNIGTHYYCSLCDLNTSKKTDYEKHLATDKHKKIENDTKIDKKIEKNIESKIEKEFNKTLTCKCGKKYKYNSGFYRHIKTCNRSHK